METYQFAEKAEDRLRMTFELVETVKNLSTAKEMADHPRVTPEDAERRFWRRCTLAKEQAWLSDRAAAERR
jgi:hypothetical protein